MRFIAEFFRDLRTPLYRNAIFLMANTVVGSGIGFFFWMVVARYYTPYEVGLAAAIVSVTVFLGMLSRFGFDIGLVRFLPSSGKNSRAMINSCFTISGAAAILISFTFLMGLEIWSPALLFIRENWIFFASFILFSVVFALFPLMNQVFVARRNAKFVLAGSLISGMRVALPILFALFFGAFGIFASWSVALLFALIIGMLVFMPLVNPGYRPVPTVSKSVVNDMIHFSAGNYIAAILVAMPAAMLPLLIVNTLPAENVAYYYIAFTIAGLLFAITYAVCMSLFAEGSHFERELKSNVRKALKFIFLLLTPAVILILFFGDYLLLLFEAEYSIKGLALLQIFAVSSIFVAFNSTFIATRQVLKIIKPIIAVAAFNAFTIVALGYILLNWLGLVGIAIAWLVSQGLVSLGIGIYVLTGYVRGRGGGGLEGLGTGGAEDRAWSD